MKILPFYLPQQGCAHQCVYCNQPLIVGAAEERHAWAARVNGFLSQSPPEEWEMAFYGGTFSALPREVMDRCFDAVQPALNCPAVRGVRISTRPDCVEEDCLDYLKAKGVRTIELGVESMDDAVLRRSGRGHTASMVRDACARIHRYGFQLGIHLMCGLPGQTAASWEATVMDAIALQLDLVRIAPTLVLWGTPLERLYRRGRYHPLDLEEAIRQCAFACREFHRRAVPIARVGLALSDEQGEGSEKVVAGPWHPSLRHEVESVLAGETLAVALQREGESTFWIHPKDLSFVVGPRRRNLARWQAMTNRTVQIVRDDSVPRYHFRSAGKDPRPLFYN